MSEKPVLLLDLGGVLADLGDPVAAMQLDMSADTFWQTWVSSPTVREFETGVIDESRFISRIAGEFGVHDEEDFAARFYRWQLRLFPGFPGAENLLTRASGGWRLSR